ncbi:MAG: hypothetical protein CMD63_01185 [Gammaproteobacteria bacterium]|nr:hypothetical protein [Gammaproteobacteria bacterium]
MKTVSILLKKKLEENIDHFLDNSQIHYLKKVLKVKEGERIHVYDGQGNRNFSIFNGKDAIKILEKEKHERKFTTTALIPFLKKTQFEFQLQKIVEVGVRDIICYVSAKTLAQYELQKEIEKAQRYDEIIASAFLQSESLYLPKITFLDSLYSLDLTKFKKIIVLHQNAKEVLSVNLECDLIVTGGEFGFDESEEKFLLQNQATFFNLGENILRAETAPIVALSRINF